jgi:7,8-dihydro-6-hydroxymethylpterin-pyrophosphokinase
MKYERVFLGLGSNLGDKEKNIADAIYEIEKIATVKKHPNSVLQNPGERRTSRIL